MKAPDHAQNFCAAAAWVSSVLNSRPQCDWSVRGVGQWDLRALVGHTSRALTTASQALHSVAKATNTTAHSTAQELLTPVEYYLQLAQHTHTSDQAILNRGISAGAALGDNPAAAFSVLAVVATQDLQQAITVSGADFGTQIVNTPVGSMLLHDYLATRNYELVMHGSDICRTIGVPDRPPAAVDAATQQLRKLLETH